MNILEPNVLHYKLTFSALLSSFMLISNCFPFFIILPWPSPFIRWASDGVAWLRCCQISWGTWHLQTTGKHFTHPFYTFLVCILNAGCSSFFTSRLTITMQIIDSIMALFRVDFTGRGELAERQQKLAQMLSRLQKISEGRNHIENTQETNHFKWLSPMGVLSLGNSRWIRTVVMVGRGKVLYPIPWLWSPESPVWPLKQAPKHVKAKECFTHSDRKI